MNSITHETDFYAWTQEQAHLLKTGKLHQSEAYHFNHAIRRLIRIY